MNLVLMFPKTYDDKFSSGKTQFCDEKIRGIVYHLDMDYNFKSPEHKYLGCFVLRSVKSATGSLEVHYESAPDDLIRRFLDEYASVYWMVIPSNRI